MAKKLSALGIPRFGCTPGRLPELVEGALRRSDLMGLAKQVKATHIARFTGEFPPAVLLDDVYS